MQLIESTQNETLVKISQTINQQRLCIAQPGPWHYDTIGCQSCKIPPLANATGFPKQTFRGPN